MIDAALHATALPAASPGHVCALFSQGLDDRLNTPLTYML